MDVAVPVLMPGMRIVLLVLVVALWFPSTSFAQVGGLSDPIVEAESDALVAARKSFALGVKLAKQAKNVEAIGAFEEALPVLGREEGSDLFYNLVNVARAARDWKRVVLYAHGFLARESGTADAAEVARHKDFAIARLALRSPAAELVVEGPAGTALYVNHTPVGGPRVLLAPGRYEVTVELADHVTETHEVVLVTAETKLTVAPRKANYKGVLAVVTKPDTGVWVFVDDVEIGVTPMKPIRLAVGRRLVRFEKEGYEPWIRYVELVRNGTETLEPKLEPKRENMKP
jgi:hypothetical protein